MEWRWETGELEPKIDVDTELVAAALCELCENCESHEQARARMAAAVELALEWMRD